MLFTHTKHIRKMETEKTEETEKMSKHRIICINSEIAPRSVLCFGSIPAYLKHFGITEKEQDVKRIKNTISNGCMSPLTGHYLIRCEVKGITRSIRVLVAIDCAVPPNNVQAFSRVLKVQKEIGKEAYQRYYNNAERRKDRHAITPIADGIYLCRCELHTGVAPANRTIQKEHIRPRHLQRKEEE